MNQLFLKLAIQSLSYDSYFPILEVFSIQIYSLVLVFTNQLKYIKILFKTLRKTITFNLKVTSCFVSANQNCISNEHHLLKTKLLTLFDEILSISNNLNLRE